MTPFPSRLPTGPGPFPNKCLRDSVAEENLPATAGAFRFHFHGSTVPQSGLRKDLNSERVDQGLRTHSHDNDEPS